MITRLQALKLIQIAVALPAYTVPATTTIGFTLWAVITLPINLFTGQFSSAWLWVFLGVTLLWFSQWACWSIFADGLEDDPPVRHLPLLLLGMLITLLMGAVAWITFHASLGGLMCGSQGIAACLLLVINLIRKKSSSFEL